MLHDGHLVSRGSIAAIALAIALPFNALASEPTPDPPEPHLTSGVGGATASVGGVTVSVGGATGLDHLR